MQAKKIVTEINEIVGSCADEKLGRVVSKMRIQPRKNQTSYRDELSSLINNFEMDTVEIGIFQFLAQYEVTPKYMLFGKIEMDYLATDRNSKEIVLLDHDDTEYVMLRCATNSDAYLAFLNIYSKYIISDLCDHFDYVVPERESLYNLCGGLDYKSFVDFCFD